MKNLRAWLVDVATLAAALAAVVVAFEIVSGRPTSGFPERGDAQVENWEVYVSGQRRGAPEPALTIVEFGDYECPACRQFHAIVSELMTAHPDEVTLFYRHWPLEYHGSAYPAARAAECAAREGLFWEFHDKLYTESWTTGSFGSMAAEVGVKDLSAFEACVSSEDPVPVIEKDIEAAAEIGAFGTPGLVVNGVLLGRIPSVGDLEEMLAGAK